MKPRLLLTEHHLSSANSASMNTNLWRSLSLGLVSVETWQESCWINLMWLAFDWFSILRFPQRIRNLNVTIYGKNAGVGDSRYSNRYPVGDSALWICHPLWPWCGLPQGLACDIPAHCVRYCAIHVYRAKNGTSSINLLLKTRRMWASVALKFSTCYPFLFQTQWSAFYAPGSTSNALSRNTG